MKRTAEFKDRRTIGYVYGGTLEQRMKKTSELKADDCYMVICSPTKNKKFIDYLHNEHSGNGRIVCLYKSSPYIEMVR